MKIVAVLLAVLALIGSVVALKDEVCGLPPSSNGSDGYKCRGDFPSWSYHPDTNECVEFVYGGCNGNDNRFHSMEECELKCKE